MQENYNAATESEEVHISNKKGFLYPIIAVGAVVVLLVASYFVFFNNIDLPSSKFTKYMERIGYTVTEVEGITHNYLQATKGESNIQFFYDKEQTVTDQHFNRNVKNIKKYYKDYEDKGDRVLGKDTELFTLISKDGKSYLFTQHSVGEYEQINEIFKALGY